MKLVGFRKRKNEANQGDTVQQWGTKIRLKRKTDHETLQKGGNLQQLSYPHNRGTEKELRDSQKTSTRLELKCSQDR